MIFFSCPRPNITQESNAMRTICALLLTLLVAVTAYPQRQTGLTPELLRDLQQSCPADAYFRAARNALTQVDAQKISLDWQKLTGVDEHFSNKLKDEKITDQKSSGRCWMFSALNLFRRGAAKQLK